MNKTLSYYENNANHLSKRYESANVDNIHELLLKTFASKSHLLEIGCGSGRDASFMYRNGFDILAVDGSVEMIAEAKRCHPELVNRLEVMKIPDELYFEDESFDGIYSIATLMHFSHNELKDIFKKISQMLKPKGKFLFSVSIGREEEGTERYFNMLTKDEWVGLSKQYNMKTILTDSSKDGLGRKEIQWFTYVMEKTSN